MTTKNLLKEFREDKSVTQDAVAKLFNVSLRSIQRWESENSTPKGILCQIMGAMPLKFMVSVHDSVSLSFWQCDHGKSVMAICEMDGEFIPFFAHNPDQDMVEELENPEFRYISKKDMPLDFWFEGDMCYEAKDITWDKIDSVFHESLGTNLKFIKTA